MKKIKELTIKEKIIISLEEPNRYSGRMIGGFISQLVGVSSVCMSSAENGLLNLEEVKNGRDK